MSDKIISDVFPSSLYTSYSFIYYRKYIDDSIEGFREMINLDFNELDNFKLVCVIALIQNSFRESKPGNNLIKDIIEDLNIKESDWTFKFLNELGGNDKFCQKALKLQQLSALTSSQCKMLLESFKKIVNGNKMIEIIENTVKGCYFSLM